LLKTNVPFPFPFPFAAKKRKFAASVYRKQVAVHLSFVDKGKQTSISRFRVQLTNPLVPFSICGIQESWKYGVVDMDGGTWMETSNGKRKPPRFSLIRLLFAHHASGSLSFVCLLTKKQTEVIRLQTDYTDLPISWLEGIKKK
jgi:hypothetical protein